MKQNKVGQGVLEDVMGYKCKDCGYEFLAKTRSSACPRCKSTTLEPKDIKNLAGLDE